MCHQPDCKSLAPWQKIHARSPGIQRIPNNLGHQASVFVLQKKIHIPSFRHPCVHRRSMPASHILLVFENAGREQGGRARQTHPLSTGYRSGQLFAKGKRDYSNPCILRTNADRNTPSCTKAGMFSASRFQGQTKTWNDLPPPPIPAFFRGLEKGFDPLKPGGNPAGCGCLHRCGANRGQATASPHRHQKTAALPAKRTKPADCDQLNPVIRQKNRFNAPRS